MVQCELPSAISNGNYDRTNALSTAATLSNSQCIAGENILKNQACALVCNTGLTLNTDAMTLLQTNIVMDMSTVSQLTRTVTKMVKVSKLMGNVVGEATSGGDNLNSGSGTTSGRGSSSSSDLSIGPLDEQKDSSLFFWVACIAAGIIFLQMVALSAWYLNSNGPPRVVKKLPNPKNLSAKKLKEKMIISENLIVEISK